MRKGFKWFGDVECSACSGTGLYVGFAEPKGYAVICNRCGGSGGVRLEGKPFSARKKRTKVSRVLSDGGIWFNRKRENSTVSVKEFYSKDVKI